MTQLSTKQKQALATHISQRLLLGNVPHPVADLVHRLILIGEIAHVKDVLEQYRENALDQITCYNTALDDLYSLGVKNEK